MLNPSGIIIHPADTEEAVSGSGPSEETKWKASHQKAEWFTFFKK